MRPIAKVLADRWPKIAITLIDRIVGVIASSTTLASSASSIGHVVNLPQLLVVLASRLVTGVPTSHNKFRANCSAPVYCPKR